MDNIISCRPASYRKFHDRAFEYLPKAGIFNVEIAPPPLQEVGAVKAELGAHGLSATSLATGVDLSQEDQLDSLREAMESARKMDVGVIFCSTKSGGLPLEEAHSRLSGLGEQAVQQGTVISMETHPDLCQNADQMLRTMEAVDNAGVRVNFDTANIYYYGDSFRPGFGVAELKRVAQYVASIHLKDTNGKPKTWFFPTLGEGIVDFPEVFATLKALGFRGPYTMEMEGIEGEDLSLEETHQRILDSMEYLRGIGAI
jgi:sugar phosphate isomerase/epimerase